jgi:hypothetical protein
MGRSTYLAHRLDIARRSGDGHTVLSERADLGYRATLFHAPVQAQLINRPDLIRRVNSKPRTRGHIEAD